MQAEYNTNKKDLEQVIVETKAKLKISQDKLNLAEKSVKHFTAQIEKKTQLLNDMNNPEKLVNIRKLVEKKTKKVARKDSAIKNIEQNQNMTTIASTISNTNTNENLLTVNSTSNNEVKKDKESVKNGILRKESKKKNKK